MAKWMLNLYETVVYLYNTMGVRPSLYVSDEEPDEVVYECEEPEEAEDINDKEGST